VTAGTLPSASAIVLAGGRSERFGSDKLQATIDGRSLVDLAVLAVAEIAQDVLVVIAPGAPQPVSEEVRASVPVRDVSDPEPFNGPLVGLLAGLERAREPLAIVVGADMPALVPRVLALMLAALDGYSRDVVALSYRARRQPLPLALRVGAAMPAVQRLIGTGERSLRSMVGQPGSLTLEEAEWRALDPGAETLRDVDRPQDLERR
jgi:molybdopterin-guanine dinucleotide biosynthesis protein A